MQYNWGKWAFCPTWRLHFNHVGEEKQNKEFLNFETKSLFFLDATSLLQMFTAMAGKYNQCLHFIKSNYRVRENKTKQTN